VSPRSFAEDPLRLVRALRFVSQLGFEPDPSTLQQMRDEAASVVLVSGERIGEELSRLLLGREPARALQLARDTGVLVELMPEFGPALDLSGHIFAVVQEAADAGDPLAVRLAALFHDLGKPVDPDPLGHAQVGARLARAILGRFRYPTRLTQRVVAIVREHPFRDQDLPDDARDARRFLAQHGDELAFDLAAHRRADARAKGYDTAAVDGFRALLEQELESPHRLSDLAVDGDDLIELGVPPGPQIGRVLQELLALVVDDPSLNVREELLERAKLIA